MECILYVCVFCVFFFKQKTAYEMRISDWSSDVCSSDLMTGAPPPHGHFVHFYAADLARGPDGEWHVLADRVRTPVGVGYALENRLALSRATGDLLGALNARRLAPFLSDLRRGLAADCERSDPLIGLLSPGRFNQIGRAHV